MKILVDMNLSPTCVNLLTNAGHEAKHWSKVGSGDASDAELMSWAHENGYVVLTADLDFGAILAASNRSGPSVVQLRSDILTPHSIGDAVIRALWQARRELSDGALISIDAAHARLRILPMK